MKLAVAFLVFLFPLLLPGSELGKVVVPLEVEPSVVQARKVLGDLATMIAEGDARTVTLGKKMERSIRRIFTTEHKVLEAKKEADEGEVRAIQLVINGKKWLRPNIHGRTNKIGAQAAFDEAREIRLRAKWKQEEISKEWISEVADFEKMLGDLEFSKEDQALVTLAGTLSKIVERTPWVDRPALNFSAERMAFFSHRLVNRERWLLLGRASEDARDFELAYDLFRQAGDVAGRKRVGQKYAEELLLDGYPGSALNYLERIGETEKVVALQKKYPAIPPESCRPLSPAALKRSVAPACVRVVTSQGFQSGFFVRQGGYLLTCKYGLRNADGETLGLAVLLEDGRRFSPVIVKVSPKSDLALLRIEFNDHDLLPVGQPGEMKAGSKLMFFGFNSSKKNTPNVSEGTVLKVRDDWKGQQVSRLALDGSAGQRGAPLVNSRGRVLGVFLSSKTGATFALAPESIREILD